MTTDEFYWEPTISAPVLYPIMVLEAYIRYGDDKAMAIPTSGVVECGLGVTMRTTGDESDEFRPLPTAIDLLWISLVDKKTYSLKVNLPTKEIASYFRRGFVDCEGEKDSFRYINIGVVASGKVFIYLSGWGRRIELCSFNGKEELIEIKKYIPDSDFLTIDEFVDDYIKQVEEFYEEVKEWEEEDEDDESYEEEDDDDEDVDTNADENADSDNGIDELKWVTNFKKNGVPTALWERYGKLYNYKIKIEHNGKEIFCRSASYIFANCEHCIVDIFNPQIIFNPTAVPRCFNGEWNTDTEIHVCTLYFNEQEVLEIFEKAFISPKTFGILKINIVSDKDNALQISLIVDNKVYNFNQTQGDYFIANIKRTRRAEGPIVADNYDLFYSNYEGSPMLFIGE